jgi:hypothetical protein
VPFYSDKCLISVYPDPRPGDALVDFRGQKPSNTTSPIFRFSGRSGIFVIGDSTIASSRVAPPERSYLAKFQGGDLVDLRYPAVDCSFLFQESGFPYDVMLHAVSGWSIAHGQNRFSYEYFSKLLGPFREEAAKDKDGRSLKAIVVFGGTNDVLAVLGSLGAKGNPASVDAMIAARDKWLEGLAEAVGVPVIFAGAGSAKNMRYDMETQDIQFPSELPQGRQPAFEVKRRIVAKAQALMFNRLGQRGQKGSWGRMKNKLYYLQKPRLSTKFCDWMGHPGKSESYLQGVLIHNVIVWACVKAGWQRDLKCKFLSSESCFDFGYQFLMLTLVFLFCIFLLLPVVSLVKPGSPRTWGVDLKPVPHVVPDFVVTKSGVDLPRLIVEEPAVKPVSFLQKEPLLLIGRIFL